MINTFRLTTAAAVLAGLTMPAATASAQAPMSTTPTSPWSISFDLGAQVPIAGDVHSAGTGTVLTLPTEVGSRSYSDIYGTGFHWAAGLGHKVGMNGEFRVQGAYTSNPAENLQVGTVADFPLFGLWDDYKAFTMDVGYRQYLGAGRARPFLGATVGFARLSEVNTEFTVPAAGVVLPDVGFFESSTVPSFGLAAGVQMDVMPRLAFQLGFELKYHGAFTDLDGLAGTGLEPINDESSRWAMPLTAGLTYRF